jgi:CO/xanthine dehydrogenase Mo-binding subunit
MSRALSRRRFVQGVGAIVVSFTLAPSREAIAAPEEPVDPKWSADQQKDLTPELDGWLRIDEDGQVTLFTGRVEIGNGVITALSQVVAEELDVPFEAITVISGDTDVVPNQGITSASTSMGVAAIVIRQASATARLAIVEASANEFGVESEDITIRDGVVATSDGSQVKGIGEVIGGQQFAREVDMQAPTKPVEDYNIVGQPIQRVDIPVKVTGGEGDFVENARIEGMTFARILRGPAFGAKLISYDESVADMDGIVAVVPIEHPGDERLARVERYFTMPGDFIAVVAEREDLAIKAIDRLRETTEWETGETFPITHEELYDWIVENGEPIEMLPNGDAGAVPPTFEELYQEYEAQKGDSAETFAQNYRGPYLSYGPIAPAFALADVKEDHALVWSSSQWPFGSRWMVAQALGFDSEEQVQIKGGSSSGLYGRRDDYDQEPDVEAAILSQEVGRPVRLQWSRPDEIMWSPYRPPQVLEMEAQTGAEGQVLGLHTRVHTAVSGTHPSPGIFAMAMQDTPYNLGPMPFEGFNTKGLLRTGYMRNVFSGYNLFALESFMDELAVKAGQDPAAYRLRHLEDPRAIEIINTVTEQAGWSPSGGQGGSGMGISFALYTGENGPSSAYMAYIAEVDVNEETGEVRVKKFTCAIDPGLVVNPDGVRNQVEGGVIQATSWAMKEQVQFDRSMVLNRDWATYPILTFPEVPEIETIIIDRKDQPAKSIGEPVTVPVSAAIANAIFDATGARVRELPFTPERVKAALAERQAFATPEA